MSKVKGNQYVNFDKLNVHNPDDSFSQVYHSQIMSPAYMDLSDGAKVLLMICKDCRRYSTAGRRGLTFPNAPRGDPSLIYLNRAVLKMYGWTSPNKFRDRMKELVLHGFITVVEDGWNSRTKNIYKFSQDWKRLAPGETVKPEGMNEAWLKPHGKRKKTDLEN